MSTTDYLNNFFDEKQITYEMFEIVDKSGILHIIDTDYVIETIKVCRQSEQNKIALVLRKIDFKNGSVNHFLKYLAIGIVNKWAA
jgi:nicotinic acid phosphoribosyltransferase